MKLSLSFVGLTKKAIRFIIIYLIVLVSTFIIFLPFIIFKVSIFQIIRMTIYFGIAYIGFVVVILLYNFFSKMTDSYLK